MVITDTKGRLKSHKLTTTLQHASIENITVYNLRVNQKTTLKLLTHNDIMPENS